MKLIPAVRNALLDVIRAEIKRRGGTAKLFRSDYTGWRKNINQPERPIWYYGVKEYDLFITPEGKLRVRTRRRGRLETRSFDKADELAKARAKENGGWFFNHFNWRWRYLENTDNFGLEIITNQILEEVIGRDSNPIRDHDE